MTMRSEYEALAELAPFYVAGTLTPEEKARFEAAMAEDAELARNVAAARAEREEVVALNEALPAPSSGAMDALFARIDAEPGRKSGLWRKLDLGATLAGLFSPRALGWTAAAACLLVCVEGGLLATRQASAPFAGFATASRPHETAHGAGFFALVAFAPNASAEAIGAVLTQAGAQIVEGPRANGFYRIRLGGPDIAPSDAQRQLDVLRQATAAVRFAAPSP